MARQLPPSAAIEGLRQNLRYSLRTLGKSPGFTAVAVLTLALGIGANTAIFSVVNAALLRPLPYREPGRLITLGETRDRAIDTRQTSYPDYQDWIRTAKSFESLAGFSGGLFAMQAGSEPENIFSAQVTPDFFRTLGVKPLLGRDFVEADQRKDDPPVAILSHPMWRTEFGGDPWEPCPKPSFSPCLTCAAPASAFRYSDSCAP